MIEYSTGEPTEVGVYATRVPATDMPAGFHEDIFLMWHNGLWWYLGSDQRYRLEVPYWIGPLRRQMQ